MRANCSINFVTRIGFIAPAILFSQLSTGCASKATNEPARPPAAQRAYIARPCPAMKEQPAEAIPVGVLLEVADVTEPTGVPLKDWLAAHPVQVHHVAKLLLPAAINVPTQSPFGTCLDRACSQSEDATLEVTIKTAPTAASAQVELALNVSSDHRPPRRLSIKTGDQEPVSASLTAPEQTVIITPYYLYEPKQESMGKLLQCASQSPGPAGDR